MTLYKNLHRLLLTTSQIGFRHRSRLTLIVSPMPIKTTRAVVILPLMLTKTQIP